MKRNIIGKAAAVLLSIALLPSCAGARDTSEGLPALPLQYNTDGAVAGAMSALSAVQARPRILTGFKTSHKIVFLTFDGIADAAPVLEILDLLDQYHIKASFFLPGVKSAEDPDTAAKIARRGHQIGNYTLRAETQMENSTVEALAENFARSGAILSQITGSRPDTLKCRATRYTDSVLRAAAAAGAAAVLSADQNLSYQSFRALKDAERYVKKLEHGSVVSIHMDSVLNEYEYAKPGGDAAGKDRAPVATAGLAASGSGASGAAEPAPQPSAALWTEQISERNNRLVQVVSFLLEALSKENFKILPVSQIPEYAAVSAVPPVFTNARTTLRSVALSFRYLQDGERLGRLLAELKNRNITATFFVTGKEIIEYPENIDKVIKAGHAVENGGMSGNNFSNADFDAVHREIIECDKLLRARYGITPRLFMPGGGQTSHAMRDAALSLGYTVTTYNKNPVAQGTNDADSLRAYFFAGIDRGDIIYGDLSKFEGWDTFIEPVAGMVRGTGYDFATVRKIFEGQYPLQELRSVPGWDAIRKNDSFDPWRPRHEDYITKVQTEDKVIFLTFDDWGSDDTITELLAILGRYNARSTFFVIGDRIEKNPNLARSIAEEGHDLVSHSYAHQPITTISASQLQQDSIAAHRAITRILGKAPPLFYRPPTLDYDDSSLNALFACGYKYIFSGYPSTHDYENPPGVVANMVFQAASPGCIVVMHMSDNSCAGEALEIILPKLQEEGYAFAPLSDYVK